MSRLSLFSTLALFCLSLAQPQFLVAGPDPDQLAATRKQGVEFLKLTQSGDGSWTSPNAPGISGLCTYALLQSGLGPDDPAVAKGLKHLETFLHEDGGLYAEDSKHRNYETSVALLAFKVANIDGRYDKLIARSLDYLRGLQWDEEEQAPRDHTSFGGQGYGSHQRPDLSNTSFFLEALHEAGVSADDPAVQKALVFVSRCQNLETQHNTTPFAGLVNDGGFYYTPAAGGSSQAGKDDNGGLRSYASMTYAGLKSMIYAGVTKDDSRVKAASEWVRKHYSVTENPGMGGQGLFYYYHTFAKALHTIGVDEFEDSQGVKHDWRKELADHLASVQKPNGSWVNSEIRWYEGDPHLVTAYSLLALKYCEPAKP